MCPSKVQQRFAPLHLVTVQQRPESMTKWGPLGTSASGDMPTVSPGGVSHGQTSQGGREGVNYEVSCDWRFQPHQYLANARGTWLKLAGASFRENTDQRAVCHCVIKIRHEGHRGPTVSSLRGPCTSPKRTFLTIFCHIANKRHISHAILAADKICYITQSTACSYLVLQSCSVFWGPDLAFQRRTCF